MNFTPRGASELCMWSQDFCKIKIMSPIRIIFPRDEWFCVLSTWNSLSKNKDFGLHEDNQDHAGALSLPAVLDRPAQPGQSRACTMLMAHGRADFKAFPCWLLSIPADGWSASGGACCLHSFSLILGGTRWLSDLEKLPCTLPHLDGTVISQLSQEHWVLSQCQWLNQDPSCNGEELRSGEESQGLGEAVCHQPGEQWRGGGIGRVKSHPSEASDSRCF